MEIYRADSIWREYTLLLLGDVQAYFTAVTLSLIIIMKPAANFFDK